MSHTATVTQALTVGTPRTQTNTYTGTGLLQIDETITTGQSDYLIACTLDVSTIKSIWICSDKAVTLETNNGAAPSNTITLKANVPYVWTDDGVATTKGYAALLLTVDVTALYITNASGSTAVFRLEALYDATP